MKVTIELTQEDFESGATVAEVLSSYFGEEEQTHHVEMPDVVAVTPHDDGDDDEPQPQPQVTEDHAGGRFTVDDALGLDEGGIPWAEELHSSSKKRVKSGPRKGRWAKKRGLPEEELEAGEAELARMYGPELPAGDSPQQEEPQDAPLPGEATTGPSPQQQPEAPLPGGDNTAPTPQQQPEATGSWTLPEFIQAQAKAVRDGQFSEEYVTQVLQKYDVPNIPMLSLPDNQPKIAQIAQELGL